MWRPVVEEAIQNYRRDHAPITIIGHSMGGDSAVAFAEVLNREKIPVSLLVTYDPTRIADDVPPNVERYINLYQSRNVMGGGNVTPGRGFHGHYASINLKDHYEIIHINIEKAEYLHKQIVSKIVELAATPAAAQGEAIPIQLRGAVARFDRAVGQRHAGDGRPRRHDAIAVGDLSCAGLGARPGQSDVGRRTAQAGPALRDPASPGAHWRRPIPSPSAAWAPPPR